MTTVFVLNAGSSSIKYTVLTLADGVEPLSLAEGAVERLVKPQQPLTHTARPLRAQQTLKCVKSTLS